ncbi:hypothetical protein E0198_004515 [Clavispora lusitaniae]|nr:hypothetical protein E0198_004515 [Clavispora lusitaniae]
MARRRDTRTWQRGNIHSVIQYSVFRSSSRNGWISSLQAVNFSHIAAAPVAWQPPPTITSVEVSPMRFHFVKSAGDFKGYDASRFQALRPSALQPPEDQPRRHAANHCYQAHFELGEVTHMFGGLRVDPSANLRLLGISHRSTCISIPGGDLPPSINKVLPWHLPQCIQPSFTFSGIFNPTRGTVQEYGREGFGDVFPGRQPQFHQRKFRHCRNVDRWIVEKKIVVNDHGYIMDGRTLRFTRVDIRSKSALRYVGRPEAGAFGIQQFEEHPSPNYGSHLIQALEALICGRDEMEELEIEKDRESDREKSRKSDKVAKNGKGEKPGKVDKIDTTDRTEKIDKSDRTIKIDKTIKFDTTVKTDSIDSIETPKVDKSERTEKPPSPQRSEKSDKDANGENAKSMR